MSGHCSNCGTVLLYGTRHLNCPGLFAAATPQPAPVLREGVDVQSLVIADVEARREMGIAKYGTPLQAHNGRDALMDAYQEALDLACYLRQAIAERDGGR